MSNFPSQLDNDVTLPPVNDNITETGAEAINACRDALLAIESEIGIGASGPTGSIAARFAVCFNPDGTLKPSAITTLGNGLIPVGNWVTNFHIAENAQIVESKLKLDFRTQDLFNYIRDFSRDVNEAIGWIDITGIKLDPHIFGAMYRHELTHIDVNSNTLNYFKNKFDVLRDNSNSYNLIKDINNDLVQHQKADGSLTSFQNVTTFNGSVYPSNFAHLADGIFLNTSRFSTIPQTATSIQDFAEFIDSASIFLYGTRIQNLYSSGISRTSRSSSLSTDGYGQPIIPPTYVKTYLLNNGSSSTPVDGIDTGDDIIEFIPNANVLNNNLFDSQFNLIKAGDIIRVDYGGIEVPFVIKEKKYIQGSGVKKFIVRINGKNLFYKTNAVARVDKPLFNADKYGVLAVSGANNEFSSLPSLIVSSPRAAVALGLGFEPQLLDSKHYILYLALFPTGHPSDGYTILPGIDITGNFGTTPGAYTLDSIIETTNAAFRRKGFNYRFIAFQYKGEFGIMLADSYNNAGFQILNGVVSNSGSFNENATNVFFPNNVVGLFGVDGKVAPDPLGFGINGSGIASPPYLGTYSTAEAALFSAKLLIPLKRNNYYVNGTEREKLNIDVGQALDGYGDGYWIGEIVDRVVFPGNRVKVTYRIAQNLSTSKLKIGKTLVIQSDGSGGLVDFGRFIIEAVAFNTCPGTSNTDITIYDAIHAIGLTPFDSLAQNNFVKIYFCADSVGFNAENSTDETSIIPSFKRNFEVYLDQNGDTFTHERARININGSNLPINGITLYGSSQLIPFNIIKVSPKLRGYKFFNATTSINKINLNITSYTSTSGIYQGYLSMWDGVTFTRLGPTTSGKIGETIRFYDETNIDYIDFIFEFNNSSSFSDKNMDIQLFPSLQLDEELFPIATCQVNDVTAIVGFIKDIRDFGNVSEKQLTTSALSYLSTGDRLLHGNGVIRGFDITNDIGNPIKDQLRVSGGAALVNGNIIQINNTTASIPVIKELNLNNGVESDITWALCINDKNELQALPLLDFGSGTNRIFQAKNPITAGLYDIDALFFSDIINDRKDLCILYIVSSVVTGSGIGTTSILTYKDVRRFVNDHDSSTPAIVTQGKTQGNFKNYLTATNWLKNNSTFQNSLAIKGSHTVATDPVLTSFLLNVFSQGAGASLTFSAPIIESRVNYKELSLTFNNYYVSSNSKFTGAIGVFVNIITVANEAQFYNSDINNYYLTLNGNTTFSSTNINYGYQTNITGNLTTTSSKFTDCNITVTGNATITDAIFTRCTISINGTANLTNTKFVNCTITVGSTVTSSNANFTDSTLTCSSSSSLTTGRFVNSTAIFTGIIAATSLRFIDCILTFTAGGTFTNVMIDPSTVTIAATISVSSVTILDSTITVSAVKGFALSDNFIFERNNVTWSGSPTSGYSSSDLVNSGNGMMYANVGNATLSNIKVKNNTFNIAMQDHFPLFSIQLTDYSAKVRYVDVSENIFNSTMNSDDVRAVVAVISTLVALAGPTVFPQYPVLVDVHFDENTCNYNQMFIISGLRNQITGYMYGAYAICNNVTISRNICGTIGYFIGSSGPYDGSNVGTPNNGFIRDKASKLIIEQNYCKFISNLDSVGDYICFRATNYPYNNYYEEVISTIGEALIRGNSCNWIQVGAGGYSSQTQSGVTVIENTVCPANPSFLNNFTGFILQSVTPANVGILLRRENNAISTSSSVISNNYIVQKYSTNGSGGTIISNATNAAPIQITTTVAHGYVTGQSVSIADVSGNTAANGTWIITTSGGTTFTLNGSVGNGAYTGGGSALASTIYYYDAGIACFNNAKICNNLISKVVNSTSSPMMYFWDINSQIVTDNVLERGDLSVSAYFLMNGLSGDTTTAQRLLITNNVLDNNDSGSGLSNRIYIKVNASGSAAIIGPKTIGVSPGYGWRLAENVAGRRGDTMTPPVAIGPTNFTLV